MRRRRCPGATVRSVLACGLEDELQFSDSSCRNSPVEAGAHPTYTCRMPEMFKCPNCGAVYEITYEKTVSPDEDEADCQVCGKQMGSKSGSIIPRYELVRMPDGTDV